MARIARVVASGVPHHITQRGNHRQQTFFYDDYNAYLDEMTQWCGHSAVEVWAYCLMPNHVHLVAVPPTEESLSAAQAETFGRHERTGRPLGSDGLLARLEGALRRVLRPRKRGPKGPWKPKRR